MNILVAWVLWTIISPLGEFRHILSYHQTKDACQAAMLEDRNCVIGHLTSTHVVTFLSATETAMRADFSGGQEHMQLWRCTQEEQLQMKPPTD